ncbi:hypothetical protein LJC13_04190, partial [Peptostreptococcaceae bacterium OttesenSCG-928-C18]|nr:hypothetical protein [Peptostreptococcaceae bacterium OttesenSCG-928-C18]
MTFYREKFKIYSFDCDHNAKTRLEPLVAYMGEASIQETIKVMEGVKGYENYAWVLYQWEINILDLPKMYDEVYIETALTGTKKFYAYRTFRIFDEDENLLVEGKTKWLLLDRKTGIPTRIPDAMMDYYKLDDGAEKVGKDLKIKEVEF